MQGDDRDYAGGEPHEWDDGDEPLETEELDLDDEDERLPWLEADDEDYEEEEGVDTGRLVGFVFMALALLGAAVGGMWWYTHRDSDPALTADGSTIEAPAEPYKQAPDNPGGKTFDGTGDTSFAVSEGQSRPAKLGEGDAAPVAMPAPPPSAATSSASKPAPVASGVGVQVGAFSSQASAEAAWSRMAQQYSALSGLQHRVQQGQADIGTVYRLQAVAGDAAAAQALCGKLKAAGLACQVK